MHIGIDTLYSFLPAHLIEEYLAEHPAEWISSDDYERPLGEKFFIAVVPYDLVKYYFSKPKFDNEKQVILLRSFLDAYKKFYGLDYLFIDGYGSYLSCRSGNIAEVSGIVGNGDPQLLCQFMNTTYPA